jgi:hypothetical protein
VTAPRIRRPLRGRETNDFTATVVGRTPLWVDARPDLDLGGHVRAGSSLVRGGGRLWIVQDDTLSIVRLDPRGPVVIPLPAGEAGARRFDDGRGNKRFKLDLEAAVVLDGTLVAWGSGSSARREQLVLQPVRGEAAPRLFNGAALYAHLRDVPAFSGSELNLEGVVRRRQRLWLVQRGNGAPVGDRQPVDALGALALPDVRAWLAGGPCPTLQVVVPLDLGTIDGVRLTPTDAAMIGGRLTLLCAAEDSPDAVRDGPVTGVAIAVVDRDGVRWARVRNPDGSAFCEKAEGIAAGGAGRVRLVTDADDPDVASGLVEVVVG